MPCVCVVHDVATPPCDPPLHLIIRVCARGPSRLREETLREGRHEKRNGACPSKAIGREQIVVAEEAIARVRGAQANVCVDRIHRPPAQTSEMH